jgi:hypothetical protein
MPAHTLIRHTCTSTSIPIFERQLQFYGDEHGGGIADAELAVRFADVVVRVQAEY